MNVSISADKIIDELAYDTQTSEVVMIIRTEGEWADNYLEIVEQLKEKITTYLTFAFAGQLAEEFPEHKDKTVRMQLDCTVMPAAPIMDFLTQVDELLAKNNARLVVNHLTPASS